MTEEEIRAAWVTEPPRLVGRIKVADYDPAWPRLFEREADRIRAVLGRRVVQLEHVGSTAVPGLAAKPVIDIMLVVPDSGDESALSVIYGTSDDVGFAAVEDKMHVHDLHATILHLMGIDHEKLTYRYSGRDFRLTDVHGRVVTDILA